MVLAVLFALTVLCVGFGVGRVLGVSRGDLGLGLAPSSGFGLLAVVASWGAMLGAPPLFLTGVVFGLALVGLGLAWRDRRSLARAGGAVLRQHRLAAATLAAALLVPLVAMAIAFAGTDVPLSPHDGAAHVEGIQTLRQGQAWSSWYPPGTSAIFAAWLGAFPGIDSAYGAFQLGTSLPVLAALALFGLGMAVWRDPRIAAAGALLQSFTFLFPYFPQIWSGWPLSIGLILVIGTWTVSLAYVDAPAWRWGVLAGCHLGAVVLVHGSELYTLAIVLPIVALGAARRVPWRRLPPVLGVAIAVALVSAAPYFTQLVPWVATGGPNFGGLGEVRPDVWDRALQAVGLDLPLRVAALAVGCVWALRTRRGRSVLAVGVAFGGLGLAFNLATGVALIGQVFVTTYPWGLTFRAFMLVAIAQALLAGAGCVVVLRWLDRITRGTNAGARRVRRLTRLLVLTWLGVMTWALTLFLAYPAGLVLGYSADDAVAMAWLRQNAAPGARVANDRYADAGIWAPYKAGVTLVWPFLLAPAEAPVRELVLTNVDRLERVPDAAAAACALRVEYVYYGARVSDWDKRRFPPRASLRASSALEEVFSSGDASVFRVRLAC